MAKRRSSKPLLGVQVLPTPNFLFLMIFFPKNKLQLRFLLKIQISDDGVKFNKLTTFLNQLQIEDSSALDELLLEHFTEWKNNFNTKLEFPIELHSIVHITL
jgi:hypothetical protein